MSFDPHEKDILYLSTNDRASQIYKLEILDNYAKLNSTINLSYSVQNLCVSKLGITIATGNLIKSLEKDQSMHSIWTYPVKDLGVEKVIESKCVPRINSMVIRGLSTFNDPVVARLELDEYAKAYERIHSVERLHDFKGNFRVGISDYSLITTYSTTEGISFYNYYVNGFFFRLNL
jgi:hypothetical protein